MTSVSSALAATWNSDFAVDSARQISSMSSLYCGPASAAWVAAVWNNSKGRQYDLTRLKDKKLFPDGPRLFHGRLPGFQPSLNDLLLRETGGELRLANEIYFRADSVHDLLREFELPVILRLKGPNIRNGLHYMVAYRSDISTSGKQSAIQIYTQDNGLFGVGNSGLSNVIFQKKERLFVWGAKRVQVV